MFGLSISLSIVFVAVILCICIFEFINGFHDTANAVATVIYTNSLKPRTAVIWSGIMNFFGVWIGGTAVAWGIANLLPLSIIMSQGVALNVAMILSILISAIIWNFVTWYKGIPCSSSHTLLGSIFGVGVSYMFIGQAIALNWAKVSMAALSLLISPIFGFGLAILGMYLFRKFVKKKKFFEPSDKKEKTPLWIKLILFLTCTTVSASHGSNDGQKGVGLLMIVLIAMLPTFFAINPQMNTINMNANLNVIENTVSKTENKEKKAVLLDIDKLRKNVYNGEIKEDKKIESRAEILSIIKNTEKIMKGDSKLSPKEMVHLKENTSNLKEYVEYVPYWAILLISLSLGLGTMIGWKRIVVTIGEKIGKNHLSYAQGATSELIASTTILASTYFGLPVSTTHVLSSGVAGSMYSDGGMENLQKGTIKNILIAWIITIPVTIILSAGLFLLFRQVI
jgi:PiT family inorganic phosphate transporter